MLEISAAEVMKLRKMSGQGIMDCKKALAETKGDIDEAMSLLRKKGMATLQKRAARETAEGRVICKVSEDGSKAAMATLCCETDFVANSADFTAAADLLSSFLFSCEAEEGAQKLLETTVDGKKFADILTEMVSKAGEKMEIGDYARFQIAGAGLIGTYVHFNGKVGAMVEIETSTDSLAVSEDLKQIAADIAMHITAMKPLAADKDGIDEVILERERTIAAEQVKNKPANIIDKIVEGKMRKFFSENCLLEQPFVKDDSKSVREMLNDVAKKADGEAKIKRFIRFEIG